MPHRACATHTQTTPRTSQVTLKGKPGTATSGPWMFRSDAVTASTTITETFTYDGCAAHNATFDAFVHYIATLRGAATATVSSCDGTITGVTALPNVDVQLVAAGTSGPALAASTTNAAGDFTFDAVDPRLGYEVKLAATGATILGVPPGAASSCAAGDNEHVCATAAV